MVDPRDEEHKKYTVHRLSQDCTNIVQNHENLGVPGSTNRKTGLNQPCSLPPESTVIKTLQYTVQSLKRKKPLLQFVLCPAAAEIRVTHDRRTSCAQPKGRSDYLGFLRTPDILLFVARMAIYCFLGLLCIRSCHAGLAIGQMTELNRDSGT